jgi:hypothetical protein
MKQINIVMSLNDFYLYIKDILVKYDALMFVEKKHLETSRLKILIKDSNIDFLNRNYQEKGLCFFITTLNLNVNECDLSFYSDDIYNYTIEGIGGRENELEIERIKLRLISKKPEKTIISVFRAIKNKLEKDIEMATGVEANSSLYKDYFYPKSNVGKKIFKMDFYNEKLPPIRPING